MMKTKADQYSYRVLWSEEDQEYVGLCSELPSLSWLDKSPVQALKGVRKVVLSTLKDLKRNKEPIPEPLSTKNFSGKFMLRVPPEIHRRLALEASEAGVSLNRLISAKLSLS